MTTNTEMNAHNTRVLTLLFFLFAVMMPVAGVTQGNRSRPKPHPKPKPTTAAPLRLSYNSSQHELIYGSHRYKMVWVEGGNFMMGSDDSEAERSEKPVRRKSVMGFYMGQTEVPQWLWYAVMNSNPSYRIGNYLPVEMVSWDDCQAFIKKLNSLTGQRFRLPTEQEWEYAARGGNRSKGYKYSGSNNAVEVAWYSDSKDSGTHRVATKLCNELGLYDMSGNVWEWTSDRWSGNGSHRRRSYYVNRGGGWYKSSQSCRVSSRNCDYSTYRYPDLGFRLAM